MPIKKNRISLILILSAFVIPWMGCGGWDDLAVSSVDPADGATGRETNISITAVFNQAPDASTVNSGTFKISNGNSYIPGQITCNDNVITFTPTTRLSLSTTYTATITTGVKDTVNRFMPSEYSFDFTTKDGAWDTAEQIQVDASLDASAPRIGADRLGNAVIVWSQMDDLWTKNIWNSRYTPDNGWEAAALIESYETGDATEPAIAIDRDGNAIALWTEQDGAEQNIRSSRRAGQSAWEEAELISEPGTSQSSQIATDESGNALAVWTQSDGSVFGIWANTYTPEAGWETAQIIETDDAGDASAPQIAMDESGSALAVWTQSDGVVFSIWANVYTPLTGWGTAEIIESDDLGDAYVPQIAINEDGIAAAVWTQSDGSVFSIWSNIYSPLTGWGTAQVIESDDLGNAYAPQIAMDESGNVIAVWSQSNGSIYSIWSNRYTPEAGWGTAQVIESDDAGNASAPQIAMDESGNAFAVWMQSDGSVFSIQANRYTTQAGWGGARAIESDDAMNAYSPRIAVNRYGTAYAVWEQSDGQTIGFYTNRFE